jgi:hypothetical protein
MSNRAHADADEQGASLSSPEEGSAPREVPDEPAADTAAPAPSLEVPLSLEQRVRRLEDVIAALHLAPDGWLDAVRAPRDPSTGIVTEPSSSAPPNHAVDPPAGAFPGPVSHPPRSQNWLVHEIYIELRVIFRMFFDPRYPMTWHTRLLTPLWIVGIVIFRLTINSIPLIGGVLDVVCYPILLYVLFKMLSREATRYRLTSPDLPAAWRL